MDVAARTRIATAVAGRETADLARHIVDATASDFAPGDLVSAAGKLRVLALAVLDRAVLAERAAGASWEAIARAHSLNEDALIHRYAAVYDRWVLAELDPDGATGAGESSIGSAVDGDPLGTAQALDTWRARHTDPWETPSAHALSALIG